MESSGADRPSLKVTIDPHRGVAVLLPHRTEQLDASLLYDFDEQVGLAAPRMTADVLLIVRNPSTQAGVFEDGSDRQRVVVA